MFSKIYFFFLSFFFLQAAWANPNLPGGQGTINNAQSVQSFSLPIKGLISTEVTKFMVGNSLFRSNWVQSPASVEKMQGLGPLFNARSCAACHFNDGRSAPTEENGVLGTGLLFRISILKDGHFIDHPVYGDQIQPQGILNVRAEATPMVKYEEINGKYLDGSIYKLQKPTYWVEKYQYGNIEEKLFISPRVAPQMIGLGLIEAIPEKQILNNSDEYDKDGDGISGRANFIFLNGKKFIGRFGWKANRPSILIQNSAALLGDLGVTSSLHPKQNCYPSQTDCLKAHSISRSEISDDDLNSLNFYTQTLGVPKKRNSLDLEVINGEKVFKKIGCLNCHVSVYKTGTSAIGQFTNQLIYPYSDFLLHDMGDELADNRPDFLASGKEWKTPPLWGIGLLKIVNRHQNLLHDGRARNVEEAILWHDGEAKKSQSEFIKLTKTERNEVIKFIESL
jgi:CxxC motif-containing protein (DUF1111 family)